MVSNLLFCIIITLFLLCSCTAGSSGVRQSRETPQIPAKFSMERPESRETASQEGSIYNQYVSMDLYQDSRARKVGDIVLVQIVESSSGTKKASTKTERESNISGGVSALFGIEKWLSDKNRNFTPSATSLKADLQNDFEGKGETKRDSTVTATLSARVIDETMDGNLVIRGYREVQVNSETQYLILSGIIRPQDIAQDNSILSSYLADARIEYSGKGVVSEKQQPGWLARSIDVLWPF